MLDSRKSSLWQDRNSQLTKLNNKILRLLQNQIQINSDRNSQLTKLNNKILRLLQNQTQINSDRNSQLTKPNNKILRILQNRNLNYLVPNLYRTNNTLPLLHNYFIIMHKFKYNRNELPAPFWAYFTKNYTIPSHNTRQIKNFHVD